MLSVRIYFNSVLVCFHFTIKHEKILPCLPPAQWSLIHAILTIFGEWPHLSVPPHKYQLILTTIRHALHFLSMNSQACTEFETSQTTFRTLDQLHAPSNTVLKRQSISVDFPIPVSPKGRRCQKINSINDFRLKSFSYTCIV